jgi:UDPglucose--hexose-1-phosphate uridylyltransferase
VVCYSPNHSLALAELEPCAIKDLLEVWQQQYRELSARKEINHVLIFENKGEIVGVSNPHPHCQIYATDFTFNLFQKELDAAALYRQEKQRNIFSDIIDAEKKDDIRIVAENEGAIAFIPFFARFAYETYVFPKRNHASLITMNDEELYHLAEAFQTVTKKFDANFQSSFPYIMVFAQAPVDGNNYPDYHTHIIICPPLRQPGLMKFLAGPETGADTFMADTMPEEKAAELRRINL